jgi:hypothetical protein
MIHVLKWLENKNYRVLFYWKFLEIVEESIKKLLILFLVEKNKLSLRNHFMGKRSK